MIRTPLAWLLGCVACLAALARPDAGRAGEPAPLEVIVSILPLKQVVERVGGRRVAVSVMVGPGQSPETYEPTPRMLSRLARARAYFRIGVAFEQAWLGRLAALNPQVRIVDLRRGIALRPVDRPPGAPPERGGQPDPHVWTSPRLVRTMASHVREALGALDPAHQGEYDANERAFAGELARLDQDVRRTLAGVRERRFMVFHPAWGYFADAYGLTQIPIELGGKEPGARSLAQAIALGRRARVKVVFVQPQASRRTAETVAAALGAQVVAVDPLAEDDVASIRLAARRFAEALR